MRARLPVKNPALGLFVVVYLMISQAAVHSPDLHDWLHAQAADAPACLHHCGHPQDASQDEDSERPSSGEHECLVVLLAQGQLAYAVPSFQVFTGLVFVASLVVDHSRLTDTTVELWQPARAPPHSSPYPA